MLSFAQLHLFGDLRMKKYLTKHTLLLLGIMLIGIFLRVVYLQEIQQIQFYDHPVGDAKNYVNRANDIIKGEIIPKQAPFLSNALYPYYLAITKPLTKNLTAPRVVQMCFGVMNIFIVYLIMTIIFSSISGLIAATITAIYPVFIFFEGDLLMISIVIFTMNISLLMFVLYQKKLKRIFLIIGGCFLGLSVLGKPDTIMLAPFIAVWVVLQHANLKKRIIDFSILTISVTLMILPLTISNYLVEKEFILLTTNGGVNFYIGNHKGASGLFRIPEGSGLRVDGLHRYSKFVAEANTRQHLSASGVSKYWFNKGVHFIKNNQGDFFSLLGKKALLMINRFELANHHSYYFYKDQCAVLKYNPLNFSVLIFFAVVGIIASFKERHKYWLLYLYFSITFIVSIFFFISDRYRLPTVMMAIIFGSYGLFKLWDLFWSKNYKKAIVMIVPAGIFLSLSLLDFKEFDHSFKHDYKNLGNVNFKLKSYGKSLFYYEKVIDEFPYEKFVNSNIAKTYYMTGKKDMAIKHFKEELRVNPSFTEPYQHISSIYTQRGDYENAKKCLEQLSKREFRLKPMLKLADIYKKLGETESALSLYKNLRKKYPNDIRVKKGLRNYN